MRKNYFICTFFQSISIYRVSLPIGIKDQTVYEMCLRIWKSLLIFSNTVLESMMSVSHVGKVLASVSLHMRRQNVLHFLKLGIKCSTASLLCVNICTHIKLQSYLHICTDNFCPMLSYSLVPNVFYSTLFIKIYYNFPDLDCKCLFSTSTDDFKF